MLPQPLTVSTTRHWVTASSTQSDRIVSDGIHKSVLGRTLPELRLAKRQITMQLSGVSWRFAFGDALGLITQDAAERRALLQSCF
jgi:hypothetical protein